MSLEKNYITPKGFARLQSEFRHLLHEERPQIVQTVSWAAKNGDRSENGDYLYGKKRLREIDRRLRFLTKVLETAEIVPAQVGQVADSVRFGVTVTFWRSSTDEEEQIAIVGKDEVEPKWRHVSWKSPVARALLGKKVDDEVEFETPSGPDLLVVTKIEYLELPG